MRWEAEFLPAASRGRWLVGLESFWALGTLALALASALAAGHAPAMAWRWIFAAAALPALIGLWFRPWIPESPAYLARTGRPVQALDVLDRVALANGRGRLPSSVTVEQAQSLAPPTIQPSARTRRSFAATPSPRGGADCQFTTGELLGYSTGRGDRALEGGPVWKKRVRDYVQDHCSLVTRGHSFALSIP